MKNLNPNVIPRL